MVFIGGKSSNSIVSISFTIISHSNKISFEEKINFKMQVIEFTEVTDDIVYKRRQNLI